MRKLITIPLWLIGFLIVVAVAGYIWITQSSWLRTQIETQVNRVLSVTTDLELSVGNVSGDLYSGIELYDLALVTKREGRIDTLALAARVSANYNARAMFAIGRRIELLEIDGLKVFVPRDSIENVFRKASYKVTAPTELKGALNLAIDSLVIRNAVVHQIGVPTPLADSIHIYASFNSTADQWDLAIAPSRAHTTWVGGVQFEGLIVSMGEGWRCDSLSVRTPESSFIVSGTIDRLQIRSAQLDLRELSGTADLELDGELRLSGEIVSNLGAKTASGHLAVDGTFEGYELKNLRFHFRADSLAASYDSLTGTVSGAQFRGKGRFVWSVDPPRWEYDGRVDGFDLNRFAEETLPTLLTGQVEVRGVGVTDEDLRIRAKVDLGPGRIDEIQFQSASGSLGATVDSLWIAEDFNLRVYGASLIGGGALAFEDSVDMFVSFTSPDLGPIDELVFIDSLAGRMSGYAYLSGLAADPDIAAFLNSDSLRLFDLRTGEFEARVFVPRFLSNPSGQIDARWGAATTWGVPTDSISLHATLSGRQIDIGWVRWYSPQIDIEGSGTLDWSADTIPLNFYPLTMRWENQTYSASDNVVVTVDSAGFQIHNFDFEGPLGIVSATGRMNFDNSMDLAFDLDRFRIERVWHRLFPTWELDGVISARGQLNGTFASPVLEMAGDVSDLEFEGYSYGQLEGSITYRDQVLEIESAELDNRYFHASASGTFPINLGLEADSTRVLSNRPLTGRLVASGDNLDPINRFLPQTIESVRGNFTIVANVTGTPQTPKFSGEATLKQGTIKTIEIINALEDVVVDLALRHDTVVIRNASAVVRDRKLSGTIGVTGTLRIESVKSFDYNLKVTGRRVPARMEFQDFFILGDFDLSVQGLTPPKVVGRVLPQRIEDREPFADADPTPVYDPTLWDWDIAIEMPRGGYSIRNDQIEAELSADLRLLRDRGQPSYLGTADFIRGKVYLFDKMGRITRGVLIFDDPLKTDPRLDLDVTFRIQQPRVESRTETSSRPIVDLNLHIGGTTSEPLIQPEAPYSEQDVLLLLAANMTMGGGGDSLAVSDPLTNRLKFAATGLVFSEVQRMAARKLGLETFEINSGQNPLDASITVGRYFSPQFYLYGTSPIDAGAGQEVGFEYRLSRRVFLDGNRDKNNLYRMNIHFNWEY